MREDDHKSVINLQWILNIYNRNFCSSYTLNVNLFYIVTFKIYDLIYKLFFLKDAFNEGHTYRYLISTTLV